MTEKPKTLEGYEWDMEYMKRVNRKYHKWKNVQLNIRGKRNTYNQETDIINDLYI